MRQTPRFNGDLAFQFCHYAMQERQLVIALDQGTTSARAVAFDHTAYPVAAHQFVLTQHSPNPGWVEHDPLQIEQACRVCLEEVALQLKKKRIPLSSVKGIGVANQRETVVVWDRRTGAPVCNAIVWSDTRTKHIVKELAAKEGSNKVRELCGLHIDAYFSAPKIRWLLDNNEHVRKVYDEGELCMGTVDSWMIFALSGGKVHKTDVTNASRSMLMNLKTMQYDDWLINFFGFEKLILPEIHPSSSDFGVMSGTLLDGVPIAGCIGDQSSALVGHLGFNVGDAKNTYGTGCFFLYNTGNKPVISQRGLLTTVAYQVPGSDPVFALEGSIAVCGSVIQWLRNNLEIIETPQQVGDLIASVNDTGGVYFVTAFSGLFCPYWRPDARGTIVGLTSYSNCAHITRAAIEAVCFQSRELLEIMEQETGFGKGKKRTVRVDGGLTGSDVIMQLQADILGARIARPKMREPTALGAAFMAGLQVGVWKDFDDIKAKYDKDLGKLDNFDPTTTKKYRNKEFKMWHMAVERACGWMQSDSEDELDEDSESESDSESEDDDDSDTEAPLQI